MLLKNGDFKVNKVDSSIDVAVDTIDFGEDAVISVKLADDATGEVVITVNGEDYTTAIENGEATVTVSDLKADDYTLFLLNMLVTTIIMEQLAVLNLVYLK